MKILLACIVLGLVLFGFVWAVTRWHDYTRMRSMLVVLRSDNSRLRSNVDAMNIAWREERLDADRTMRTMASRIEELESTVLTIGLEVAENNIFATEESAERDATRAVEGLKRALADRGAARVGDIQIQRIEHYDFPFQGEGLGGPIQMRAWCFIMPAFNVPNPAQPFQFHGRLVQVEAAGDPVRVGP